MQGGANRNIDDIQFLTILDQYDSINDIDVRLKKIKHVTYE